jgi:hypothetical protein
MLGLDKRPFTERTMTEASDEVSFTSTPQPGSRRVPTRIGIPVVIACALVGYAISLVMPLHPRPAVRPQATAAGLTLVETRPQNTAAAAKIDPPAKMATPMPQPAPLIETGSVDAARERPGPTAEKAAAVSAAPNASPAEAQVRRVVPRRPRYIYRRPVPKKFVGPFDALWPTYPK